MSVPEGGVCRSGHRPSVSRWPPGLNQGVFACRSIRARRPTAACCAFPRRAALSLRPRCAGSPTGQLVLALLLAVEQATKSFAVAGAASAVFALCTLSGPAKARFMGDQQRRRRVGLLSAAYVGSLLGLAVLASRECPRGGTVHRPVRHRRPVGPTRGGDDSRPVGIGHGGGGAPACFRTGPRLGGRPVPRRPLLTGALVALDGPGSPCG